MIESEYQWTYQPTSTNAPYVMVRIDIDTDTGSITRTELLPPEIVTELARLQGAVNEAHRIAILANIARPTPDIYAYDLMRTVLAGAGEEP